LGWLIGRWNWYNNFMAGKHQLQIAQNSIRGINWSGKKVFLGILTNNAPSIVVAESFGCKKIYELSDDRGLYFELEL